MSLQDPIGDMLARIRNACMASLPDAAMPTSKLKTALAAVLKEEGYIRDFAERGEGASKDLVIHLKYHKRKPVIEGLKRISKPSCRIYCGHLDIPKVRNGMGTVVLSTPKGVMSGKNAVKASIGGEILCYIW